LKERRHLVRGPAQHFSRHGRRGRMRGAGKKGYKAQSGEIDFFHFFLKGTTFEESAAIALESPRSSQLTGRERAFNDSLIRRL